MKKIVLTVIAIAGILLLTGCTTPNDPTPTAVTFESAVAADGADGTANTTGLTLTFSVDPTTLAASNITVTGATKGALSGSGLTRTLAISAITVGNGETVSVAIASPSGFTLTGSPKTAVVYRAPTAVTFESAIAADGADGTANTTELTLTFSVDPTELAASDITVTGATKGALSGTGTTRTLAISDITVGNGETVSVAIANPSGYAISGSPQTAVVYRELDIGMAYQGGVIAYILQSGDPGYVSGETHGLIAATVDQSTGIVWISGGTTQNTLVPGETGTALGTGSANTDNIIAQAVAAGNNTPTSYAAGLARAHDGGGYSDWYLPSQDELDKLYLNRTAVGGFADFLYWSSSETNSDYAWHRNFSSGNKYFNYKYHNFRVRAVRAF